MAELSKVVLVVDLDKTLCTKKQTNESYADVLPNNDIIDVINSFNSIFPTLLMFIGSFGKLLLK